MPWADYSNRGEWSDIVILPPFAIRYTAFAVLAIAANLGAQRIVLSLGDSTLIYSAAVFTGTAVGLVLKYLLDKKWIFFDHDAGLKNHSRKFMAYTATGVLTTCLFWASETLFWVIWQDDIMRETGALIGLSIGYWLKFRMDRQFVFKTKNMDKVA